MTLTLFALQSVHDAQVYHSALVSYTLRACGLAVIGSIQTPNGGLFSACLQNFIEWERVLTSSVRISAPSCRRNTEGLGSLFIRTISLCFFFFAPWFTHIS